MRLASEHERRRLQRRARCATECGLMSPTSRPPPSSPSAADPSLELQLRAVAAAEQAQQLESGGHAATARVMWLEASALAERAAREAADEIRRREIQHAAEAFAKKASAE